MNMEEGNDQRGHPRVTIVEDLYFDDKAIRPLVDLNQDGMFVATEAPYLEGSILELRFRLFQDDRKICTKAQVMYVQEGFGMGLQFVEISDEDRERIRSFVERL